MSEEHVGRSQGRLDGPEREQRLDRVLARPETWAETPTGVADRVIAAIAAEAPRRRVAAGQRWWRWAAAAAAVVAVLLAASTLFDQPTGIIVSMEGTELAVDASGQAILRERGTGWWIGLEVSGLAPAGEGQYYEGWLWREDGEGVSIGTFHLRDAAGPIVLWSGVDPADYPSLWVTLEDEDGDPSASERVLLRGHIPIEG